MASADLGANGMSDVGNCPFTLEATVQYKVQKSKFCHMHNMDNIDNM